MKLSETLTILQHIKRFIDKFPFSLPSIGRADQVLQKPGIENGSLFLVLSRA